MSSRCRHQKVAAAIVLSGILGIGAFAGSNPAGASAEADGGIAVIHTTIEDLGRTTDGGDVVVVVDEKDRS